MKTTLPASLLLMFSLSGPGTLAQEFVTPPIARNDTPENSVQKAAQKPLTEVLKRLEKKYGIFFVYNTKALEGKQVYEPGTYPANPEELLLELLNQVNLQFERINEGNYAIKRRPKKEVSRLERRQTSAATEATPPEITSLSLLSVNAIKLSQAAEFAISGRVTAADTKEGLPGVSVSIKGTTNGTTTDADGQFKLTAPDGNAVLVLSFIGYVTEEVPVNNQATIDITMAPDIQNLSEVVVTGYTTERRKTMSSSVVNVRTEEIQNQPVARVDNMLQGRAAGVQVVQNNGAPGTNGTTIRIRGISSLRAGNDPLIIVDGVPLNGFIEDINPNDIETFTVLKDAASSAKYGARAANGVIVITTKRGKGKPKVTLNSSYGVQTIAREYETLTGPEQWEVMQEMYRNTNQALPNFFRDIRNRGGILLPGDTASTTNWPKLMQQKNAPIAEVNLGLTGSEGRVKYATSLNFFKQQGILKQSGFQRLSGRLNLDIGVTKKIRFGNSLSVVNATPETFNFNPDGLYITALVKNPLTPVYDVTGRYFFTEPYQSDGGTGNPLATLNEVQRKSNRSHVIGNIYGEADLVKGLVFRTTWGIDYRQDQGSSFTRSTQNQNRQSSGSFNSGNIFQWINTNTLTYTGKVGEDHNFSLFAIHEQQEFTNQGFSGSASRLPGDVITTLNGAARLENVNSNRSSFGLLSFVGSASYNFREKYIFEASVRHDGSSRFGRNNRFATFPSVSLAWNVSDEPFMQNLEILSSLKIKGSVGQVGNQSGLSNFGNRGIYFAGTDYTGEPGILPGAVPNYNLKWETTTQYSAGIEAGLLDDRISLTAEAYLKKTTDLLLDRQLPGSAGVGSITVNLGEMENRGAELAVTSRNLVGARKWSTNFNISFNRNKVTKLYGNSEDLIQVFAPFRTFAVDGLESLLTPGRVQ